MRKYINFELVSGAIFLLKTFTVLSSILHKFSKHFYPIIFCLRELIICKVLGYISRYRL